MSATLSPLSVSYNPWFWFAGILLLRFVVVGMAWSWTIPQDTAAGDSRFGRWTIATAWTLLAGLTISVLTAALLAEAGLYTVAAEAGVLAVVTVTGLVAGVIRKRRAFRSHVVAQIPGAACLGVLFGLIMLLPNRGEWIAGGWDPGTYVNQGVMVSRTETFHPDPDPLLSQLTTEEFETFTRPVLNYIEYLPVVPVDPDARHIEHFFFRATPSVIAVLFRSGGLRAATRVNHVLGCMSLVVLFAMAMAHRRRLPRAWFAVFLTIVQPVWLFMLSFPTSEMLQLVLVCGLGALMTVRRQSRVGSVWIPLLLFLAVINRFSFFPFAGLFLCMMTWIDARRLERGITMQSRGIQATAVIAGLLYDTSWCPVAVGRLDELIPMLVIPGFALIATALVVEALRLWTPAQPQLARAGIRTVGIGLAAAAVLAAAADLALPGVQHLNTLGNALGLLPFLGVLAAGLAVTGYVLIVLRSNDDDRAYAGFLYFLGASVVVTLSVGAIAGLYPWAIRRHLVYTVPLLALLGAEVLGALWQMRNGHTVSHCLALILAGGVAAGTLPKARQAFLSTEFNQLSDVLADASVHIDSDAVVVADHFRWGTPLKMLYGRDVLNGEVLWQADDADRWGRALAALQTLRENGRPVLWFTSTEDGIGVFEDVPGTLEQVWTSGDVAIVDMVHHPDMREFRLRSRHKVFTLLRWSP